MRDTTVLMRRGQAGAALIARTMSKPSGYVARRLELGGLSAVLAQPVLVQSFGVRLDPGSKHERSQSGG